MTAKTNFNMRTGKIFAGVLATLILLSVSINLLADIDGRTGRTRKSSTAGCGSCHGSSSTAGVTVTINGPDTVTAGQTAQFSMVITRAGKTGAGLDVATRRGTLGAVTSGTRVQSGEITHNDNLLMSNGTVTILFNYIAPATIGLDTIWAVGIATNTSGGSSGDEWNWSANRSLYVKLATGIGESNSELSGFSLSQNYPNPFNPRTIISYVLPARTGGGNSNYVQLNVFDISGKFITSLVNANQNPGRYEVEFDSGELSSGVYIYALSVDGKQTGVKQMTLLK